jgi:nucleoside-diphosphate-sugar epimerase
MTSPLCSFVAGATGFVGGHLVRQLVAMGHKVRSDADGRAPAAMAGCDAIYIVTGDRETIRAAVESGCRRIVCSMGIQSDAPVVYVQPTEIVGPGDAEPSPTGRLITRFLGGRILFYADRPMNLIAVEDVAVGYILAGEKGTPGACYLLENRRLMLREMYQMLSELTGLPMPIIRWPTLFGDWPEPVATGLGVPRSSVRNALARAVCWFSRHGYASRASFAVPPEMLEAIGDDDGGGEDSGALSPPGGPRV